MTEGADSLRAPDRLLAVQETTLLDTPPEEAFDRLTRVAARSLGVPLALVNLVDDQRQFSKSCYAPPEWPAGREAPLKDSICRHVVIAREPLRIEDTKADPRASSSAMVTELGIRSYLGVPLTAPEGHVLGTLCVSDFTPRRWTDEDLEMLQDLAASVQTEIELRRDLGESEHRYLTLVEGISDYGIVQLGTDGSIRAWNTGAEQATGYSRQEVLGRPISLIYGAEDVANGLPEQELEEALRTGRAEREGWRVHKDGSLFWGSEVLTPIWKREILHGYAKVLRDQTAQKQSQEREKELIREQAARKAAEAAEHQISEILESITDAFFALDGEWRFSFVNRSAQRILQRSREDLLGKNVWDEFPEAVGSTFWTEYHRAVDEQSSTSFEAFYPPLEKWVAVRAYPSTEGLAVYVHDITARKAAEEALRESETRFRQLAENVREIFWLYTPDFSRALYVSPAYENVFELPLEGEYRFPTAFLEVVHPEDKAPLLEAMAKVVDAPQSLVFRILRRDGSMRALHARGTPIRDERGEVYRVAGLVEDITEQRKAAEALERARQEAEVANRAKSEFLSRMSHELRTPLNAILGFGQIMEMDARGEEDRESVEQILKAGRHLLRLIDEVLDIARIEAGHASLAVGPVALGEVLQESIGLVRPIAKQHGIELHAQEVLSTRQFITADEQRLKQVLLNFLSNAIKYNRPQGSVTLSCGAGNEGWVRIGVRDSGHGIAPEKLDRLFTPFERLDAARSGVEGTGLGLALSKGLVEAMGGRLGVDSVVGEGSTFWVELPPASGQNPVLPVPGGNRSAGEPEAAEPRYTVLIVEDSLANVRLMERVFRRRPQVRLLTAMQGSLGLDLAREHRPDLILMDLYLPDIPGDEALLRLKQDPALKDIPVIMISGVAIPSQVHQILKSGARAYITKPFDMQELLRTVDELLKLKAG